MRKITEHSKERATNTTGYSTVQFSSEQFTSGYYDHIFMVVLCNTLVGWGLTALLTQNRSYRACRFVGIFYSKL